MESAVDYEDMLTKIGGFGRYQLFMYSWHVMNLLLEAPSMAFMTFGGITPHYVCANTTQNCSGTATLCANETECHLEGQFYSVVWEWRLFSENSNSLMSPANIITSLQMAGVFVGPIIIGLTSDRFGRKPAYLASYIGLACCGLASAFSVNWQSFAVARFCIGLCLGALIAVNYVMMSEILQARWRMVLYILGWPFGFLWLGVLAKLSRHWHTLSLLISITAPVTLLMTAFVYESPKWLLERGHKRRAYAVLQRIAVRNRVSDTAKFSTENVELTDSDNKAQKTATFTYVHLFYDRIAATRTCILMYSWCTTSLVFYGLMLSMSNLSGDVADNFMLVMVFRMVVMVLVPVGDKFIARFGRRQLHQTGLAGLILCALLSLIAQSTDLRYTCPALSAVASMGSLVFAGPVWAAVELYSVELFPTLLRNMGNGICSASGRIGGILAPISIELAVHWQGAPMMLYLILLIFNLVMSVLGLPETKGKSLPELPVEIFARTNAKVTKETTCSQLL